MADMTLEQFRDHLATQLGVKGRGQTLSSDDANYLETIVTNCHDELSEMEVAVWDENSIPPFAVESLVLYCRGSVSRFGLDPDPAVKFAGLRGLRYVTADTRNAIGKADYF